MGRLRILGWLAMGSIMFASCASTGSSRSYGPYSEAEALYKKGNYPKAIEKYQEYLGANPQGSMAAIAEYSVAKSHLAMGDAAKARESFESVIDRYPGTSWARFAEEQLSSPEGRAKA